MALQYRIQRPAQGPAPVPSAKPDTTYIHDTLYFPEPVPVYKFKEKLDTVYLPESGVEIKTDSLIIPIETTIYRTDQYKAVVEGYRAKLSDLEIYGTSTQITTPPVVLQSSRWGLGVTAGVAVTKTGWAPALTLGITYNIYQPKRRL